MQISIILEELERAQIFILGLNYIILGYEYKPDCFPRRLVHHDAGHDAEIRYCPAQSGTSGQFNLIGVYQIFFFFSYNELLALVYTRRK